MFKVNDILKRLFQLFLPLLLSLVPAVILQNEAASLTRMLHQEENARKIKFVTQFKERFKEITTYDFWVEETSRKLNGALSKFQERVICSPADIQSELFPVLRKVLPRGIPLPKVWGFYFPEGDSTKAPGFCAGNGFEKSLQLLFTDLAQQLVAQYDGLPSELDNKNTIAKLRTIFGEGLSREIFNLSFQGKAINVVFQREFQTMVWDFVMRKNRPVGVYFLFFPSNLDQEKVALKAAFQNWPTTFKKAHFWPGYISFPPPKAGSKAKFYIFPSAKNLETVRLAKKISRTIRILPSTEKENLGKADCLSLVSEHSDDEWRSPAVNIGEIVSGNNWNLYPTPINPALGKIGILLEEKLKTKPVVLEQVFQTYKCILFLFWIPFILYRLSGGVRPILGIREILALWFLALIASPLTMGICSQERLMWVKSTTMTFALRNGLENLAERIESGITKLDIKSWRYCSGLTNSPNFCDSLNKCSLKKEEKRAFERNIKSSLLQTSVAPLILHILDCKGNEILWFDESVTGEVASKTASYFRAVDSGIFRSELPEKELGPALLKIASFNMFRNDKSYPVVSNSLFHYSMGSKNTIRYFNRTLRNGKLYAISTFIWNQEKAQRQYLKEFIPEIYLEINRGERTGTNWRDFSEVRSFREMNPYFAAFEKKGNFYQSITAAGDHEGVTISQKLLNFQKSEEIFSDRLQITIKSNKISGAAITAGVSLKPLFAALIKARNQGLIVLLLFALFSLSGAYFLAEWLGSPIRKMIRALDSASLGDYQIRVVQRRGDEIEETGKILDSMTEKLREREVMGRFVSDQVLKAITKSGQTLEWKARSVQAVALVCDIRDFTTHSEKNPPEAIFSMINKHTQEMGEIIKRHGGDIERFIGDAIQAIFLPAPLGPSVVQRALSASKEMMCKLAEINFQRTENGLFNYKIGIGLDMGTLVSGMVGDEEVKLDLAFLGAPMNRAAELEALSKKGISTRIVCSKPVRDASSIQESFSPLVPFHGEMTWEVFDNAFTDQNFQTPSQSLFKPSFGENVQTLKRELSSKREEIRTKKSLPQGIAMFLLWVIPLTFTWTLYSSLQEEENASNRAQINAKLTDEMKQFEKTIDPKQQISEYIQRYIANISEEFQNSNDRYNTLKKRMEKLVEKFPSLSWRLFESRIKNPVFLSDLMKKSLISSGGLNLNLADSLLEKSFGCIQLSCLNVLAREPLYWDYVETLKSVFLTSDWEKFSRTSHGNFIPVQIEGKTHFFSWFPLDYFNLKMKNSKFETGHLGLDELSKQFLSSGLFIFIQADDFSPERGADCAVENLSQKGISAGVSFQSENKRKIFLHPKLTENVEIKRFLFGEKQLFSVQYFGNCIGLAKEILSNVEYRVYMASENFHEESSFRLLEIIILLFFAIWSLVGIHLCLRSAVFGDVVKVSLKNQLVLAIFLGITLLLLSTSLSIERVSHELREYLLQSSKESLIEKLSTIDRGREIQLSYFCSVTNFILDLKILPKMIFTLAKLSLDKASKVAEQLSLKIDSWCNRFGVSNSGFMLYCPKSFIIGLGGILDIGSNNLSGVMFKILMSKTLNKFDSGFTPPIKTQGKPNDNIVEEALAEEVRPLFQFLISAEISAKLLNAPVLITRFLAAGVSNDSYCFQRIIMYKKTPAIFGTLEFSSDALDKDILSCLFRNNNLNVNIRNRESQFETGCYPFFKLIRESPSSYQVMIPIRDFDNVENAINSKIADVSESTVFQISGKKEDQRIECFYPGQFMKERILSASIPIGRVLESENQKAFNYQLLLVVFLIFGTFLAIQISRSFLEPIGKLGEEAKKILHDDFTARLPEYDQIDFYMLSQAFNRMVDGVYERERLRKFVSESVQLAAKDQSLERIAQRGENLEVTILFSGLSGFKKQIEKLPPEILMERLNAYSSKMSRIILENGGTIEKFIGDKILGVFHPRKLGGTEQAAFAALKAAKIMQTQAFEIDESLECIQGIGVVSGPVIAGIMGSGTMRSEYTVLGDTVNLASRLCDISVKLDSSGNLTGSDGDEKGGIVIESKTYELIQANFPHVLDSFKILQMPPIKGKTRSVRGYFDCSA
ncbi:MAG: HAMP domain-containing protein [Candidatus Riflebacteria bacterium]|nr:HAMP domain-containing protein [Candidatus Riflebacteria bacterium]